MRRKLPRCPYCGERMFPQATQEKFAYEKEGPDKFNQMIRVLRWMDFKGATTQDAERRMEVRG